MQDVDDEVQVAALDHQRRRQHELLARRADDHAGRAHAVRQLAGPYLERLVVETNETAVLSVWDGEAPVVVRVDANTSRLVRIVVTTGSRLPLDSAQGKVFRAFMAGGASDAELAAVRDRRVAHYGAVVEGIGALAAPVFQGPEIVATLALVGTAASIDPDPEAKLAQALRDAADALSTELGFVQAQRRDAP